MSGHPHKPGSPYHHLHIDDIVDIKRANRMNKIDDLSPELRALVHEYGLTVVNCFLDINVTKPKQIRHIVERILDEFSPTRGTFSQQGVRGPTINTRS